MVVGAHKRRIDVVFERVLVLRSEEEFPRPTASQCCTEIKYKSKHQPGNLTALQFDRFLTATQLTPLPSDFNVA